MTLQDLVRPFPWTNYSKKLSQKIMLKRSAGAFTEDEARDMRLVETRAGSLEDGNAVHFYCLVDPSDGVIVDVKYQLFGQSALIGAAELVSEAVVGKNYQQALRINALALDKQLRDHEHEPAFPEETQGHLELVLEAIHELASLCSDIPLSESYIAPPIPTGMDPGEAYEYPGWEDLSAVKQVTIIEGVVADEIRPYIMMDGGDIEILNVLAHKEVMISYKGNCSSCFSAIGATLSYIQQTLQTKVHPELIVVPDVDPTQFMM